MSFYRRYAGDPLVVDKGLQAAIPEPATLDRSIGYARLADVALEPEEPVDGRRLGIRFRLWRAVRRIATAPNLSCDLADIAGHSLDVA